MAYAAYRATLALHTPLGTPIAGDTLFGHLCWALREARGTAELTRQLEGYGAGSPWLVLSDAFPGGYLPKPTVPAHYEPERSPEQRKAAKGRRWVARASANLPLRRLLAATVDDATAYGRDDQGRSLAPQRRSQSHNTLDRQTGTTGTGAFAPFTQPLIFHAAAQPVDIYLVLDEDRLDAAAAGDLLRAVGLAGYGRDTSLGLGKFSLEHLEPMAPPDTKDSAAVAWWTLAPCAPQGLDFAGDRSYWRVLTRFGRHGNAHALAGQPYKTPVLLAATGAMLTPRSPAAPRLFVGQGLGGQGALSKAEPATVHQGYAPVLPLALE